MWKKQVQEINEILSLQCKMVKQVRLLPFPDDVNRIVLSKLHRAFLIPDFIVTMKKFLDGLCKDDYLKLDNPRFISEQTACARQNGMLMLFKVLCRHKHVTFMHMQKMPSLLKSVSKKISEMEDLNRQKIASKRCKRQIGELTSIKMRWKKFEPKN